jgi:glycosyltransferase involved in cell wall biosynthesis
MKILILFPYQWGYNTDFLFYSTLLSEKYEVTYIGYNLNLPGVDEGRVNVINVNYSGKLSLITLMRVVIKEIKKGQYSHLLLNYFLLSSILKCLLPKKLKIIVDIRTSFIYQSAFKTKIFNTILKVECKFFSNITVVSAGLKQFLKLPKRTHVLPLGGPVHEIVVKNFDVMNFLYVGTFYDRDLVQTVKAFSEFVATHSSLVAMKYTIIGYGSPIEMSEISDTIRNLNMERYISYLGAIRYPQLNEYLLSHNFGICYIPLTDYYDCQPPTKTFEYLLSGIVVLGTNTTENRRVIDPSNGLLTYDSASDFYNGMVELYNRRFTYSSENIQKNSQKFSWTAIVSDNLVPYLNSL